MTPLLWMLDELKKTGKEGLTFRGDVLERWTREASSFEALHDSREKLGVVYRYDPRNAQPKTSDGKSRFAALVHYSVIERMASGHDRYAPTSLPRDAKVLLPNGRITHLLAPKGALPDAVADLAGTVSPRSTSPDKLSRALDALKALDEPKAELIEIARDAIWLKRVNYFCLVCSIVVFLALPFYAEWLGNQSEWLGNQFKKLESIPFFHYWNCFLVYWNDFWDGVGSALGFIVGAIIPKVAGYVPPYLTVLSQHPAVFALIAIILWFFYSRSITLEQRIAALSRAAWLPDDHLPGSSEKFSRLRDALDTEEDQNKARKKPTLQKTFEKCARKVRKNACASGLYGLGARYLLPGFWAATLVFLAVAFPTRVLFMFLAGWGHYCTETPGAKSVGDEPLNALSIFKTNSYCWASGLKVTRGASYRLRLTIEDPWLDGTILTDARGFKTLFAPISFFIRRPFLRWAFDGWLQPIARVGKHGDSEWLLASKDQTGPLDLIKPQCPGAPKRYEKSTEYCEFHGYAQNGECKRPPPAIGWFDPLPDNEMKGVTLAWHNALSRSGASSDCLAIQASETFESDFIAPKDGELFLFANESMPILGADSYRKNRGTATVTLQSLLSSGVPAPSEK